LLPYLLTYTEAKRAMASSVVFAMLDAEIKSKTRFQRSKRVMRI